MDYQILEKFDELYNNKDEYEKVPYDQYVCSIEKMRLTEDKKNRPLCEIWFKIEKPSDYQNRIIFYKKPLYKEFHKRNNEEFLKKLCRNIELYSNIENFFKEFSFIKYDEFLQNLFEGMTEKRVMIKYYENENGFKEFEVLC